MTFADDVLRIERARDAALRAALGPLDAGAADRRLIALWESPEWRARDGARLAELAVQRRTEDLLRATDEAVRAAALVEAAARARIAAGPWERPPLAGEEE